VQDVLKGMQKRSLQYVRDPPSHYRGVLDMPTRENCKPRQATRQRLRPASRCLLQMRRWATAATAAPHAVELLESALHGPLKDSRATGRLRAMSERPETTAAQQAQ